ncbi:MAG: energy-coupling factor ABC transporter permease [Deltaproteobacteria bacterium]|nr:energy-coupling factor ABC transporter permease [Deltaproteobacteria bacterium]
MASVCHNGEVHLPDGLLRPAVFAPLLAGGAVAVGWAARASRRMGEDRAPLMGILGAFVFAAQLVNVPVGVGTSGHFLGTVLLTVLLGWAPAALTMTAVLLLQALVLQDGGLTALGANVVNMAVAPALLATLLCRLASSRRSLIVTAGVAAWLSVLVTAALLGFELWLSGTAALGPALAALLLVHVPIGGIEALVTVLVLRFLQALRPDLVRVHGTEA